MNNIRNSFIVKKIIQPYKNIAFSVCLVAIMIVAFRFAVDNAAKKVDDSALNTQLNAIKKAAVQCYALEGFFPPNIEYLAQNYGIIIDYDKFIIHYTAVAENIIPEVVVLRKHIAKD